MDAANLAKSVIEKYGTNDSFIIAEKAGVRVVYESWYPTTIGEFEREGKTIHVNQRALENNKNAADLERIIVAHELGHYFALDLNLDRKDEEVFAHEFAAALLKKAKESRKVEAVSESKIQNPKSKIFLGVDGGQSHTEAVAAVESGCILGRGFGGASNHAEQPGGRERLRNAVKQSVGEALRNAGLPVLEEIVFASAHFGMTGGADFKEETIRETVKAEHLQVTHDAPTALYGATSGKPGIVVIAGTGSVVYGENEQGETTKIGGLGYLFSDEGSGFWLAAQTIRLAIKEQDGLIPNAGLERLVLDFFKREQIREVTNDFYFGKLSRDRLASLSRAAHEAAAAGNSVIQNQIRFGAAVLVESVGSAARRLGFEKDFPVAGVGGMFRAELMKQYFAEVLREKIPAAVFTDPRFNPAIGALLLAFRKAGIEINKDLLNNLAKSSKSE